MQVGVGNRFMRAEFRQKLPRRVARGNAVLKFPAAGAIVTANERRRRDNGMKSKALTLPIALAAAAWTVHARSGDLDQAQLRGRQIFAQSCGICHLQPSLGVKTYGPPLNKTAAGGSDEVMRAVIVNGTDRMPAFKYYLKPAEIDAIIAYLRTVPAPAAPSRDTAKGKADAND